MKLQYLQENFILQLVNADNPDEFLTQLASSGHLQPEQQLMIYQANMRSALQQTLAQIYPVCHKIVGENYFKQLAHHYIKEHPSKDSNLNLYGEYFTDFIHTQYLQRSELNDFSYLSDLVQLEWLYHSSYYAKEGAVFNLSAFSQLTPEQQASCSFLLAPQLKFITSEYPILSIWLLNQQDQNQHELSSMSGENCCVFRENNHLKAITISDAVFQLLTHIQAGQILKEISQMTVARHLPELIQSNWISGFKIQHV